MARPKQKLSEAAAREAIIRLRDGHPLRAPDLRLTDRNLQIEAGIPRPTLYRLTEVMQQWQATKCTAVVRAVESLRQARSENVNVELSDRHLLELSRVDAAAFHRMPESVLKSWEQLKTDGPNPRVTASSEYREKVKSLTSKLYALTLAIKHRDEIISGQNAEIARLGGNVVVLAKLGADTSKA